MKRIHRLIQHPLGARAVDLLLAGRTVLLAGSRYHCPCCGWSLRSFTRGGASLRPRVRGYCPRCNSKPRHRWLWYHVQQHHPELFTAPLRLLHVSPSNGLAFSFRTLNHLRYVSTDLDEQPNIHARMDLTECPFPANCFDVIICLHVLEHVEADREAIGELYRLLKPGGWALVAVPIRMDEATFEDATVTTPAERQRLFGERDHVRFYGGDFYGRLSHPGFHVQTIHAHHLAPELIEKYGLKAEEVMFYCTKPA